MSINILNLRTTGIKELVKSYIREHASEIAIIGIMTTLTVGIAFVATGDLSESVEAVTRRRR